MSALCAVLEVWTSFDRFKCDAATESDVQEYVRDLPITGNSLGARKSGMDDVHIGYHLHLFLGTKEYIHCIAIMGL